MKEIKTVQLFVTCLVDNFYPDAGFAVVNVLEKLGLRVEFHQAQTCCGQPAYNGGFWDDAREMARHTIDVLSQSDAPVVIPSGSCGDMIIHGYAEILKDDPVYAAKAQTVASRTYEFTQFLVDILGVADQIEAGCGGCMTYHASCHGLRGLGLRTQSQTLLNRANPDELRDLNGSEECCGFGGLFAIKMSDISGKILDVKLDNVEATGADVLIGGDVSCLMHMSGGLHRRGSQMQVKHIAEVLNVKP
ncbi:MAG: (Fe-S)-binding protein [Candidatus Promineifilaceae bacterium]